MDINTATEVAYKNGYEQGMKDAVKHGEWRIAARDMSTHTVLVECSECYALLEIPMTAFGLNYDYCPNCGADMRGE